MHLHHNESDPGILNRIKAISIANGLIGATELTVGVLANSSTLTMAGMHDVTDGMLYAVKHSAAKERDVQRKQRLRRIGAGALIGTAVTFGAYELVQEIQDPEHKPARIAAGVGIVAAAANITATGVLYRKRNHADAQDSWKHVAGVDLPGSLITLVITPLTIAHPEYDIVGAAAHVALATGVGIATLRSIQTETT